MNNRNLQLRLIGYINSFLASSFLILFFKRQLSDFDYSLWGILSSLTLILTIFTQFTVPNMIEKDFIDLDKIKKIKIIFIYFKFFLFFSPLIYFIIFLFYYFNKFYYSHMFLIPLLILLLIFIENFINIINKILITTKESWTFDKVELFLVKYLRLIVFIFYFLFAENLVFLQVLFLHCFTRFISLIMLLYLKRSNLKYIKLINNLNKDSDTFFKLIKTNKNNFLINLSQFFFYNTIYLISSYLFTEEQYANVSLYFIVFMFCRNFFDAFANLKTPEIKKDTSALRLSIFEKDYFLIATLITLIFIILINALNKYNLYYLFANFISEDDSKYILFAVFHGFITGIYSFRHYIFKFNKTIFKTHLNFYMINFLISSLIYLVLIKTFNLHIVLAYISVLIVYELLNLIFYYIFFQNAPNTLKIYNFSISSITLISGFLINNILIYLIILQINLVEIYLIKFKNKKLFN